MPQEVYAELIEESGVVEGITSYSITRTYCVAGLTGDPAAIPVLALSAPGIPALMSAHPVTGSALLTQRRVVPKSHDTALVVCQYEWARLGLATQWYVGTSLMSEETSYDYAGKKISVDYQALGAPGKTPRTARVSMLIPTTIIRSVTYQSSGPGNEARANVGTVNSAAWAGSPPHTWMVTSIEGNWIGTNTWEVTRVFTFHPQTWNTLAVCKNADGTVPHNVADLPQPMPLMSAGQSGNGWKIVCLYNEVDFSSQWGNPGGT